MRYRVHHWAQLHPRAHYPHTRITTMFGVDVRVEGKWLHTHESGTPCFFEEKWQAQMFIDNLKRCDKLSRSD